MLLFHVFACDTLIFYRLRLVRRGPSNWPKRNNT